MHNKTIAVTPGRQDTTPPEFRGGKLSGAGWIG